MRVKELLMFLLKILRNPKILGILADTDYVQLFGQDLDLYVRIGKIQTPELDIHSVQRRKTAISDFILQTHRLIPEGVLGDSEGAPFLSYIVNQKVAEDIMDAGRRSAQTQTAEQT